MIKRSDYVSVLLPPVTYQGAKQRVAKEIVDLIFKTSPVMHDTKIYDLCCGTGAIALEFISRGVSPENITMLDKSSWGLLWSKIGKGEYDIEKLNKYIDDIPKDKSKIQNHLKELSKENPDIDEEYKYILLQAGAFGGKQIWKENGVWNNTSFRSYWQPTTTSNRRSSVNPMMPMPDTIRERMKNIIKKCKGINGLHLDIYKFLNYIKTQGDENAIIYLDPPYRDTTGYGFRFDWKDFISQLFNETLLPIYVSEKQAYSDIAYQLNFKGNKGGISGKRKSKNEEWLNLFQ